VRVSRRGLLPLAAGLAALAPVPRLAAAQAYPARPVRLVVGYAAGGTNDILARLLAQWLTEQLGQPFVVENRPGASTNIATEAVVRAPADGYTLLQVGPANTINATLFEKLNFNFLRDIAPVASVSREAIIMVVNLAFPAKTVPEFVEHAKANPGKINMASTGSGSSTHLAGELFQQMAGIRLLHVPYRGGGPALTDLLGNQVQVYFPSAPVSLEYVRTGSLRALAVTTATRLGAIPNVPAVAEFLPGFEASALYGIGAPKNTPVEIIERLNTVVNKGLADPKMKARFAALGSAVLPVSPADFGKLLADETDKWGKVVTFSGAKPE
jgi:tripartite-type tricarboxylate transporter receptor subunit TctC